MSKLEDLHPNGHYTARLEGVLSKVIPPNDVTILDWLIPVDKIIDGADYEAVGRNVGDRISLQVVHPQAGVVGEFATKLFVREFFSKTLYGANLPKGLSVRVVYENVGPNSVDFNINLSLHERQ